MAITNVTEKYKEIDAKRKQALLDAIDSLELERAPFALKALLLAQHVNEATMKATLEFVNTAKL